MIPVVQQFILLSKSSPVTQNLNLSYLKSAIKYVKLFQYQLNSSLTAKNHALVARLCAYLTHAIAQFGESGVVLDEVSGLLNQFTTIQMLGKLSKRPLLH